MCLQPAVLSLLLFMKRDLLEEQQEVLPHRGRRRGLSAGKNSRLTVITSARHSGLDVPVAGLGPGAMSGSGSGSGSGLGSGSGSGSGRSRGASTASTASQDSDDSEASRSPRAGGGVVGSPLTTVKE